jgi:hypothetical protein
VEDDAGGWPPLAAGRLYPAAPNPFNPRTTVRYELARDGHVALDVYALDGHHVRTLVSEYHTAGEYEASWDGRDDGGRRLASGVYLIKFRGSDFVETQRVALVK